MFSGSQLTLREVTSLQSPFLENPTTPSPWPVPRGSLPCLSYWMEWKGVGRVGLQPLSYHDRVLFEQVVWTIWASHSVTWGDGMVLGEVLPVFHILCVCSCSRNTDMKPVAGLSFSEQGNSWDYIYCRTSSWIKARRGKIRTLKTKLTVAMFAFQWLLYLSLEMRF